jgi:hypothetical protein
MKFIFYQHKSLHASLQEALLKMTGFLFWLEWPQTMSVFGTFGPEFLSWIFIALWIPVGTYLFVQYWTMKDLETTRRKQFIVWSISLGLNALIPLGLVVGTIVFLARIPPYELAEAAMYRGVVVIPIAYFSAKAVMSAYLALRAWNFLQDEKLDRDRDHAAAQVAP